MRQALAKLSILLVALGCLQCGSNDISSCDFACINSLNNDAVQFSPPLTQSGSYSLDLKDPSGAINISCAFSLPCSVSSLNRCINKNGVSSGTAAVECTSNIFSSGAGQITGISSISSSLSSSSSTLPDNLSLTLSRDGTTIASEAFSTQPRFEIREQCGCSSSSQSWVVEIK